MKDDGTINEIAGDLVREALRRTGDDLGDTLQCLCGAILWFTRTAGYDDEISVDVIRALAAHNRPPAPTHDGGTA